ncbi:MAG: type II toxin-antitoxin system RelE/ParE family toxin [Gammaproteobacteria bacterium]|nr:type II toxin-antitoxin system RelE/ParE family toxin [Gammaproteobacteria bacterium]MYF58929.1 type II toxin-antitoxin system RelE/ParE family toxin [Gammaproteobacteria bacterium]MYH33855.1 type II toxin-antitoxin system RelE/ParE family toxin [Gammaproteobacteria bacterium]MYL01401.1 type II toxin-antitoxin system RelE/ParE family toxin [Gammaproteobacteria bacterium]
MTYRIVFSRAAEKDLARVSNRATLRRLVRAIEALADEPRPAGARKLRSATSIWRIRVGDWRVCYTIEDDELLVLVLTAARRGNVYERLRKRLSK